MYTISTSFFLSGITPEKAVDWWLAMENDTYTSWHPAHREWQWHCAGEGAVECGDRVAFHETIGKFDIKVKARLAELDPSGYIRFDIMGAPSAFSFKYDSEGNGTRVTYTAEFGFRSLPGRILDPLIKKLYPPDEYGRAITEHVKEEHRLITGQ